MIKRFFVVFIILCSVCGISFSQSEQAVPKPFMDLYFDFTGSSMPSYPKEKVNISQLVYQATMQNESLVATMTGPLVMFIDSTLYIYDEKGKQVLSLLMRTAPDSGFFQMTSISHVGPSLAYLAYIKQQGSDAWKSGLVSLQQSLIAVKKINAATSNNWVTQVNAPAWKVYDQAINNMVDYASSMAGNYIADVLSGNKSFTPTSLESDFLQGNKAYPIPYDTVMVGTFMLTAYQSMTKIHSKLESLSIDWSHAKVMVRFVAGSNVSAGVSADSNWLVPFVKALSKGKLSSERIFITPYMAVKPSLTQTQLSKEDFTYYNKLWTNLFDRTRIANAVFTTIPSIFLPSRASIPGDYSYSKASDIGDFLMRLKFSLSEPTEYLSNTVAFWLAGELAAKKWDLTIVELPGFTTGFPQGITTYPANNPAIKTDNS